MWNWRKYILNLQHAYNFTIAVLNFPFKPRKRLCLFAKNCVRRGSREMRPRRARSHMVQWEEDVNTVNIAISFTIYNVCEKQQCRKMIKWTIEWCRWDQNVMGKISCLCILKISSAKIVKLKTDCVTILLHKSGADYLRKLVQGFPYLCNGYVPEGTVYSEDLSKWTSQPVFSIFVRLYKLRYCLTKL